MNSIRSNIQQLRKQILDKAIRGELVPQDPNDESALLLIQRLQQEKEYLIKLRKIKKEKNIVSIDYSNVPFRIPDSWIWTNLGSIGEIIGGGTPSTTNENNFSMEGIPWLTPADLSGYREKKISKGARDISEKGLNSSSAQIMPEGTVLFSSRAPIGYVAIAANPISTNQGFKSIVPFLREEYLCEYIYYFLLASREEIANKAPGTTFKEVSGGIVKKILIPLPPKQEQERIVKKVDALMKLCDDLEEKAVEVDKFISLLQDKVFQSAVEGKLVEQDPNDEPASILIERIQNDNAYFVL